MLHEPVLADLLEVVEILNRDSNDTIHHWIDDGRLFLKSWEFETDWTVRFNASEITVAYMALVNKRVGHGTAIFNLLIQYAHKHGQRRIIIENACTPAAHAFANKHGFRKVNRPGYSSDYILNI